MYVFKQNRVKHPRKIHNIQYACTVVIRNYDLLLRNTHTHTHENTVKKTNKQTNIQNKTKNEKKEEKKTLIIEYLFHV